MEAASRSGPLSRFEQLRFARQVIRQEGQALLALADRLQDSVCDAVELIAGCRGNVIVTGMGKAGLVGQKIAATFASTGTNSHFVHPAEAIHGDLGRIHADDIVLALSFSGETEEMTRLLPSLAELRIPMIAITGKPASTLGKSAAVTLDLGTLREACFLGLAPSTSTTAMLALGDALALVLSRLRNFAPEDFARFHPGGSLGRKLAKVEDVMRPLADCRVASDQHTLREVLIQASRPGRRTGAVMLIDETGVLSGIFTDSDLARLLESSGDAHLEVPIGEAMTRRPVTIDRGAWLSEAVKILARSKISELPVVDDQAKPVGLIDITDVVGIQPVDAGPVETEDSANPSDVRFPKTVPFPNHSHRQSRT